jgi:hypothetical protein
MIIKLDKIINTTIPNENTWFILIQGPTFIIQLDKIVDSNTASKCMVQIGSRTNIYHKIGQNYKHNNTTSKCMVQIGSLGPTFIVKLDKTADPTILNQNACFRLFQGAPIH